MTYQPRFHVTQTMVRLLGKMEAAARSSRLVPPGTRGRFRKGMPRAYDHYSPKSRQPLTLGADTSPLARPKNHRSGDDKREILNYYECPRPTSNRLAESAPPSPRRRSRALHATIQKASGRPLTGRVPKSQNAIFEPSRENRLSTTRGEGHPPPDESPDRLVEP
jgi:hypothetical protein